MAEERLKLAVFIDFDNIQIGVKETLGKEFDVSVVLEALKERGEVATKVAYGDWPRAGEQSRRMTQHAVQMVQRDVTPRGDKNGADINLALDALEMAFTRHHINAFAIVGGDSDFIALVEKLKQYDKRVFVVGGRAFTSNILQRNCHEFIAYENLLKSAAGGEGSRPPRSGRTSGRSSLETRPLPAALPNVQRALKILAEREVAPQLGLLKSTLLQLDPTFTERDYGAGTFLEFMQKMERANLVRLRRSDRSYLVEPVDEEAGEKLDGLEAGGGSGPSILPAAGDTPREAPSSATPEDPAAASGILKLAVAAAREKSPNRPLYMRQMRHALRSVDKGFDERRYGFRGILDLLHHAQREGWLRLQRDRKGVWRIFPIPASSATSAAPIPVTEPAAGSAAVPATEPAPAAAETISEAISEPEIAVPHEVAAAPEPTFEPQEDAVVKAALQEVSPPVIAEAAGTEAPTSRRARKPRTARASAKSPQRRAPTRRKSKEPEQSNS